MMNRARKRLENEMQKNGPNHFFKLCFSCKKPKSNKQFIPVLLIIAGGKYILEKCA
jgi:hypothetical protein